MGRNPRIKPFWAFSRISGSAARHGLVALVIFLFFLAPVHAQEIREGILNAIWGDPQPGSPEPSVLILTLTEDDGQITEIQVSEELLNAAGGFFAWNGRRVRIALDGGDATSAASASGARRASALTLVEGRNGESPDAIQLTGSHPWVSILCKFADVPAEPENLAYFQGMYANEPGGLDDYWREVSYGNIDIVGSTAVDWVDLPHDQTHYVPTPGSGTSADLGELFDDCTAAADPLVDFSNGSTDGFSGINMMFNANLDCCAWGGGQFATLDGVSKVWRTTWEPPWGYANSGVIAHEMGHGFGLPHANNWDGDSNPYDNPWDVMSNAAGAHSAPDPNYGLLGQHTNAYHKMELDWISGPRLLVVNDGETVSATIDATSFQGSTQYLAARLPIPGSSTFYTVEARMRTGTYESNLPGDAVIIHFVVPGRSEPSWSYDSDVPPANYANNEGTMFRVGETFIDSARDIAITIDGMTANGFEVTIDRGGEGNVLDFVAGFE